MSEPEQSSSASQSVEGTVTAVQSRWNASGDRIITESEIFTPDGRSIVVRQAGGTVDGIGMVQFPGLPLLGPGDQVTLEARATAVDQPHQVTGITSLVRPGPGVWLRGPQGQPPPLGYVRTVTDAGTPLSWASGCVLITYDSDGTSHLSGEQEFDIMDQVFETWRQSTQDCSYLAFETQERKSGEVGFDGVNLIKFRDESWCRPATDEDPEECYDFLAAGLTTLFFVNDPDSKRNGEILDADIELNGVTFAISFQGASLGGNDKCLADLANTFTHEVGHLMGLDHTCLLRNEPPRQDQDGNPVPTCSDTLPSDVLEATMHPSQTCGETKKATLEDDDTNAICTIYPQQRDPGSCEPVALGSTQGCCTVGPGSSGSDELLSSLWLLAGVGVLLRLRRRRTKLPRA